MHLQPHTNSSCVTILSFSSLTDDNFEVKHYDVYTDICPFEWTSNWHGKKPTEFRLTVNYIMRLMQALTILAENPVTDQEHFLLPDNTVARNGYKFQCSQRVYKALCKHTCAVIYFAMATMSGPLFEPGTHGQYDTIGRMDGCPEDYLQQELKCAKALFTNLGVKDDFFNTFIYEQNPSIAAKKPSVGSTQRAQRMFNEAGEHKISYPKVRMVFLLGMSGKPSWDGRCSKKPRLGARATEGKRSASHPVHYTPHYVIKRMRKSVRDKRQEILEAHTAESLIHLGDQIVRGEVNPINPLHLQMAIGAPTIRNRDFQHIPLDPNTDTNQSRSRNQHHRRFIPINGNQQQRQHQQNLEPLQFQEEDGNGQQNYTTNYDVKGV